MRPSEVGDVLDDRGVDRRALKRDRLGPGQQGHFGAKRLVVHLTAHDHLRDLACRVQGVGDRGRLAECRRDEVDPFTVRREGQALVGCSCRIRRPP